MKTFVEYVKMRDLQERIRTMNYRPGAVIPTSTRPGGPEKMNPLGVVRPFKPKTVKTIL